MTRLIKSMLYRAMPESQQLRYLTYLPSLRKWREMHWGLIQCLPTLKLSMSTLTTRLWGIGRSITSSLAFTRVKVDGVG